VPNAARGNISGTKSQENKIMLKAISRILLVLVLFSIPFSVLRPLTAGAGQAGDRSNRSEKAVAGSIESQGEPGTTQIRFFGGAQVTMENRTGVTLDLYVDGVYAGTALRGLFVTAQVNPGTRQLVAKAADGRSASHLATVGPGGTFVWIIE
jgi:hypothetical protein